MLDPGVYNLGDVAVAAINAATVATVVTSGNDANGNAQAFLDNFEGMVAATIQANFNWGAGGTSLKVMIETTLDQGVTWLEVARFAFATASAEKVFNLIGAKEALAAVTPGAQSDDVAVSGIFGDRWRAKILAVGTYTGNTSLSLRINAR